MEYFLSVFLGTFILEDVALVSALALVAAGKMEALPAFAACFLGIAIGDVAIYAFGYALQSLKLGERFSSLRRLSSRMKKKSGAEILTSAVILARFVPGTRVVTYLVAGLLHYPVGKFLIVTAATVLAWVGVAFTLGQSLLPFFKDHWVLTILTVLLALRIVKFIVKSIGPVVIDPWERKALRHAWRRWTSFEFWPPLLFYLPIVPYYAFLSLKHRSFFMPFYANPEIENGGLLGESKWNFLKHLDPQSPHTLKGFRIGRENDVTNKKALLSQEGFTYPFILKPDIGQRGFGVRIIRDDAALEGYLLLADFDLIAQRLSQLPCEAGVFYVRHPGAQDGIIFSITDKIFPVVVGDGSSRLGDLILKDSRARIIAPTYFSRHRRDLDGVVKDGAVVPLAECGNHCQGAIFLNGNILTTPELTAAIHAVALQMPRFYFGRFDIRYKNTEALKKGLNFEIVEVNGSGAEATHIWDAKTTLFEAYRTLFTQWALLFKIGSEVRHGSDHPPRIRLGYFLKESYRVFFRKEKLSVSS